MDKRRRQTAGGRPDGSGRVLRWKESGAVYVGKLDPGWLKADPEGKSNFWGMPVGSSDWKLSGWSYFREPDVRWWMPCPDVPELAERGQ